MDAANPDSKRAAVARWRRRKGLLSLILLGVGVVVLATIPFVGLVREYGDLKGTLLTGSPEGAYYRLGTRLAARADRAGARLRVQATAGSVENADRLIANGCEDKFAFVQDGTPVPESADLALLGRLPEPESLILLARKDRPFATIAELRGAAIGIGPEGSGTAYLMRQLFSDTDLKGLDLRLSTVAFEAQAAMVAEGSLDIAAYVIREDAPLLRDAMRRHGLDIVNFQDIPGLVERHPWLSLGHVSAGRYDLVNRAPAGARTVLQVHTLVLATPCAKRADRMGLLMLLNAELPRFVRVNPPTATSADTAVALAPEARQFLQAGEAEFADRYFPWLVNLMSPVYWVYLVMVVTFFFKGLGFFSRFRLWRIDSTREKLEQRSARLLDEGAQGAVAGPERQATIDTLIGELSRLRARCRRYVGSYVTPMGDEMFYRYQQSLIEAAIGKLRQAPGSSGRNATPH